MITATLDEALHQTDHQQLASEGLQLMTLFTTMLLCVGQYYTRIFWMSTTLFSRMFLKIRQQLIHISYWQSRLWDSNYAYLANLTTQKVMTMKDYYTIMVETQTNKNNYNVENYFVWYSCNIDINLYTFMLWYLCRIFNRIHIANRNQIWQFIPVVIRYNIIVKFLVRC